MSKKKHGKPSTDEQTVTAPAVEQEDTVESATTENESTDETVTEETVEDSVVEAVEDEVTEEEETAPAVETPAPAPIVDVAATLKKAFTFKKKFPTPTKERVNTKPKVKDTLFNRSKNRLTSPAVDGVHANPTYLQFPTDKWGLTKDLKAAMIAVASRIAGSDDKKVLFDEVLRIAVGHVNAKFAADKIKRDAQMAAAVVEAEARKK